MPSRRSRGRHRRPSAATRLTAVGVVGIGATAAGMIAPAVAHAAAATDVQWDRVAQCESGGNWHDNTGNGYFGGLQFSARTWASFDTDHYAKRADLASRGEQIDVANRVLSAEGWNAWPVCSQYAGPPGATAHERSARLRHAHHHHHHAKPAAHRKTTSPAADEWTRHYVVKRGDTLFSIAKAHDVSGGWRALYRHNRAAIGPNPSHLHVGMRLVY